MRRRRRILKNLAVYLLPSARRSAIWADVSPDALAACAWWFHPSIGAARNQPASGKPLYGHRSTLRKFADVGKFGKLGFSKMAEFANRSTSNGLEKISFSKITDFSA